MNALSILWLDAVFDEETINSFPSISPAAAFWQRGFVESLQAIGHKVHMIGYPVERVWPFGKFSVHAKHARLSPDISGEAVGYLNLLGVRALAQKHQLARAANRRLASEDVPDLVVTFSCISNPDDVVPSSSVAIDLKKKYGIPWICIVADGVAPAGADGYVYLTWSYFASRPQSAPSIHIDGGVPQVNLQQDVDRNGKKALMYFGALTEHGGVTWLARSFSALTDPDIELWVCGRGENRELAQLAGKDERIKLIGFVTEAELDQLASAATAFANPRPISFEPNKLNYPSKLLHYLAYGKPVISTFTEGIGPEYEKILIPIKEESDLALGNAIEEVLNLDEVGYTKQCAQVNEFSNSHSWLQQIESFQRWLQSDVITAEQELISGEGA